MNKILFISSYAPSLINFRLELIKDLLSRNHSVSIAAPKEKFSNEIKKELNSLGVNIYTFSLSRTGLNFFREIRSLYQIFMIIKKTKPGVIIAYTVKPVIYSGLIVKFFKKIRYYPLITGLGYAFISQESLKHKIFNYLIIKLYNLGLKNSTKIIFQNKDDQDFFNNLKIINKEQISKIVNGSGVDLDLFPFSKLPTKPVFLMISRLLIDKGVREYVEAAKIVRSRFPDVIFQLAGYLDKNPSSITKKELQKWINEGCITYLGEIKPVQSILRTCRYYVLPSYREGTPRSTLEALATGRPVITTDVPGCRETVIHEKNGLLVKVKDPDSLAKAMIRLLKERDEVVKKMATQSYLLAKHKFQISNVNKSMLNIMNL